MRKRKTKKAIATALTTLPTRRYEAVCRITFNRRTEPFSAEELAGLDLPDFLRR